MMRAAEYRAALVALLCVGVALSAPTWTKTLAQTAKLSSADDGTWTLNLKGSVYTHSWATSVLSGSSGTKWSISSRKSSYDHCGKHGIANELILLKDGAYAKTLSCQNQGISITSQSFEPAPTRQPTRTPTGLPTRAPTAATSSPTQVADPSGETTTSCHCVGCSADKHTVNAAANATACGQACSASSSCKISLFDSDRNVPPMGVKCFLYDEAPTSVANTGLSRFTCWRRRTECKAVSSATGDAGYSDSYRGWYDVQGCGKCNDYCRWVGDNGSGGDPSKQLHVSGGSNPSWWSCRLAGSSSNYSPRDQFTSFAHKKCSGQGAQTPSTTATTYTEVGSGHCVDSNNKRPPHCYTHDGSITDENTCKSACTAVSGCSGYEWGQTGGYCQLIWTTGISSLNNAQHSATTGSCSSSVLNNWKYNLNGDSNYAGGAIAQTYHNTGGKCYRKG